MMLFLGHNRFAFCFAFPFDEFGDSLVRRHVVVRNFDGAVAKHIQGEVRDHLVGNPLPRFYRILAPDGWAGDRNSTKGESGAGGRNFEGLAPGATRSM